MDGWLHDWLVVDGHEMRYYLETFLLILARHARGSGQAANPQG
jgi:hypothetical protein